jgi:hypothetical protein
MSPGPGDMDVTAEEHAILPCDPCWNGATKMVTDENVQNQSLDSICCHWSDWILHMGSLETGCSPRPISMPFTSQDDLIRMARNATDLDSPLPAADIGKCEQRISIQFQRYRNRIVGI